MIKEIILIGIIMEIFIFIGAMIAFMLVPGKTFGEGIMLFVMLSIFFWIALGLMILLGPLLK